MKTQSNQFTETRQAGAEVQAIIAGGPKANAVKVRVTKSLVLDVDIFPMLYDVGPEDVVKLCAPEAEPDFQAASYSKREARCEFLFWDSTAPGFLLVGLGRKGSDFAYRVPLGISFDGAWLARVSLEQMSAWFEDCNAAGRLSAEMGIAEFLIKQIAGGKERQ